MADITFYYDGIESTTLTASAGGDTSNLKDRNPSHKWTSGATTNNQTLTIDFGSARSCDSCVIEGQNFTSIYNDASQTLTVSLLSSTDNSTYTSRATFLVSNDSAQKVTFSSVSARFWQIKFAVNTGSLVTAPTLGNIILGAKLEMTNIPYNASFRFGSEHLTNKSRAIDGTWYSSQTSTGSNKWFIQFSNFSNAIRSSLLTFATTVRGNLYPFYFMDSDSSLNLVVMNADQFMIEQKAYNVNDTIELELEKLQIN